MSGELRIDEALWKAYVFLIWLSLAIFAGSLGLAYVLYQGFSGHMSVVSAIIAVAAGIFFSTWVWGVQAVKWRLWAFPKVSDYRLLEQKAINRQLIWPRDHVFTRLEMAPKSLRNELQKLYEVLEDKTTTMESIDDRKYPDRTKYKQERTTLFAYIVALILSLYLMLNTPKAGIVALIFFVLALLEWRKVRNKSKLLVIDDSGVEWQGALYRWEQIRNYQVKALSMQQKLFELIIDVEISLDFSLDPDSNDAQSETIMTRVRIDLDGLTHDPFSLEAAMDGYKYRHAKKRSIR